MRAIKDILLMMMFLAALVLTQNAHATLTDVLPESSHYQGSVYFAEDNLKGRIDFAVYDTLTYPDEFGFEVPGDDQYIYVYQIFNDYEGVSEAPCGSLALLGIESAPITQTLATDDLHDGIEPTDISKGFWAFGNGGLIAGEHSWFLISNPQPHLCRKYRERFGKG